MKAIRAKQLLRNIVDYITDEVSEEYAVRTLLNMGFTPEELIEEYEFNNELVGL